MPAQKPQTEEAYHCVKEMEYTDDRLELGTSVEGINESTEADGVEGVVLGRDNNIEANSGASTASCFG